MDWDEQSKDIRIAEESRFFGVDDLAAAPLHSSHEITRRKDEEEDDDEKEEEEQSRGGEWEKVRIGRAGDAIDWSRVPIGILPGQTLAVHSLELPEFVDQVKFGADVLDLPTLSYHWSDGDIR